MRWQTVSFDWNHVRAFLVTAEEGSLSAAARALGLTQPTLSRQVAALEEELGITLFERVGRTLRLTGEGLDLLEHVRPMGEAAGALSLAAAGRSQAIEGKVSITSTHMTAIYHLPRIVAGLRAKAPGIEIEVVASNALSDLKRREADIAIRHVRPEQPDLIARKIGETTVHLYASRDWVARHGRPRSPEDLSGADFIGFEHPERLLEPLGAMGLRLSRENFRLYSVSGVVCWAMMREGLGVGLMVRDVAERFSNVEQLCRTCRPSRCRSGW